MCNLLGALLAIKGIQYEVDTNLNNINDGLSVHDVIARDATPASLNFPDNNNEVLLLSVARSEYVRFQICLSKGNSKLWKRSRWSETEWGSWGEV